LVITERLVNLTAKEVISGKHKQATWKQADEWRSVWGKEDALTSQQQDQGPHTGKSSSKLLKASESFVLSEDMSWDDF
jgi:hypothetical protein